MFWLSFSQSIALKKLGSLERCITNMIAKELGIFDAIPFREKSECDPTPLAGVGVEYVLGHNFFSRLGRATKFVWWIGLL